MRQDAALPRCAATSAPARLQRSNAPCLRDAGNREKHADSAAFFLVWENRHSYLDLRNGAVTTHLNVRMHDTARRCVGGLHDQSSAHPIDVIGSDDRWRFNRDDQPFGC
ncbi:hypothetical protein PQU63_06095 [Xanthomonas protegens]|uniref:Uncharacterized protein n=1 Tax=Xanthomonas protegens TaxID=3380705 RepID=A0ABU9LA57_9XANT